MFNAFFVLFVGIGLMTCGVAMIALGISIIIRL